METAPRSQQHTYINIYVLALSSNLASELTNLMLMQYLKAAKQVTRTSELIILVSRYNA